MLVAALVLQRLFQDKQAVRGEVVEQVGAVWILAVIQRCATETQTPAREHATTGTRRSAGGMAIVGALGELQFRAWAVTGVKTQRGAAWNMRVERIEAQQQAERRVLKLLEQRHVDGIYRIHRALCLRLAVAQHDPEALHVVVGRLAPVAGVDSECQATQLRADQGQRALLRA
ncbi:hypothetical protein D3C77_433660 [compost metagenome]